MKFAVVLLAGGEGRRIGGDKHLRLLDGVPLIDRVLAKARRWSDDVRLSVRQAKDGIGTLPCLRDDPAIGGPLAGIAAALQHAEARSLDAVLTVPCDTPFLPDDLMEGLKAAIGEEMAALAESAGRIHPACALWQRSAIASLPAYLETGRRSIHGFAEHVGHTVVSWPVDPIDPFFNINDQDDLAKAEAMIRSR